MITLLQRVTYAKVKVNNEIIGKIAKGILVFLGVERDDEEVNANRLAERILGYRIFPDQQDRMNLNVKDAQGSLLIVPQFTLAADTNSGLRPSFTPAASPDKGKRLFDHFTNQIKTLYHNSPQPIAVGRFGANMQIELCNDGPVTFILQQ